MPELRLKLNGSKSSSEGVPSVGVLEFRINFFLRQNSTEIQSPIGQAKFSFLLTQLQSPLVFRIRVANLFSSVQLRSTDCEFLASKITDFALQLAAGNYSWNRFHIFADINYIQLLRVRRNRPVRRGATNGASDFAIERLRKRKFENLDEDLGDCSVCYEELLGKKEVMKMPCDHVYHESCIVSWLKKSNSCPMCRSALD